MAKTTPILKIPLENLALSPDRQIQYLKESGCKVTDLAGVYFNARSQMTRQEKTGLTPQQVVVLDTLDGLLRKMIYLEQDSLWSEGGLKKHERWMAVRQLALAALEAFQWEAQ